MESYGNESTPTVQSIEIRILGAIALYVMCTLFIYVCAFAHVLKKKLNFIRLGSEIRIN